MSNASYYKHFGNVYTHSMLIKNFQLICLVQVFATSVKAHLVLLSLPGYPSLSFLYCWRSNFQKARNDALEEYGRR